MIILGKYVITPEYDEMVIIPNKNEDIFICYENVNYENEIYTTKVIDMNSKEILKGFSNIEVIENYNNSEVWFEDGVLRYKENDKYGLIDFKGNVIVKAEYDNIYGLLGVFNNIIVEKSGKKGLVNTKLKKLVIEPNYSTIELLTSDYSDGYIVSNEGKYGIINSNGKNILECKYSKIYNYAVNDNYLIFNGTDNIIINKKEEEVLNLGTKIVTDFNNDCYIYSVDNKFGILNSNNEIIVNAEYDHIKYIFDGNYIISKNGKYGVMASDGQLKIELNYLDISYIKEANILKLEKENNRTDLMNNNLEVKLSDIIVSKIDLDNGYIRIRQDENYKYYNFKFNEITNKEAMPTHTLFLIKENGKYGYVNSKDEKIVDAIYDDAKEQNQYGYCVVKKDGLWGVIKSDGSLILNPSVNLDENLFIDFISTWHLYNNENLNIYTK